MYKRVFVVIQTQRARSILNVCEEPSEVFRREFSEFREIKEFRGCLRTIPLCRSLASATCPLESLFLSDIPLHLHLKLAAEAVGGSNCNMAI